MEKKLNKGKSELQDLQSKFDLLEEDFVVQKAQVTNKTSFIYTKIDIKSILTLFFLSDDYEWFFSNR